MSLLTTSSGVTSAAVPNAVISASVAANALTIRLMNVDGTNASPSAPLYTAFVSDTGSLDPAYITTAQALTISSGSTMGAVNGIPFRIWLGLFNDNGTIRLAAKNCVSTSFGIHPLPATGKSLADPEGSGGADLTGIFYAGVSISSLTRFRVIGYLDWNSGLGTVGNWSAAPDVISVYTNGAPLPGFMVQRTCIPYDLFGGGAFVIPYDDTIPSISEGSEVTSRSITPTSPINFAQNDVSVVASADGAAVITLSVVKTGVADALSAVSQYAPVANLPVSLSLHDYIHQFGATSTVTFHANVGVSTGNIGVNGTSAARRLGGVSRAIHFLSEIMA